MRHPPTDPAFPNGSGQLGPIGLTKREHFSALILAGMCANADLPMEDVASNFLAKIAIARADALLQELAVQKKPPIDRLTELSRLIPDLVAERDRLIDEARSVSDDAAMADIRSESASDQLAALAG